MSESGHMPWILLVVKWAPSPSTPSQGLEAETACIRGDRSPHLAEESLPLAMCVGSLISTVISVFQEKVARRYGKMTSTPEGRLYFSCVQLRSIANWMYLVRIDSGTIGTLDCTYHGNWVCDHGPIFHLPCGLQLPNRHYITVTLARL